jgi:predicted MFS family arabinose efflux permease
MSAKMRLDTPIPLFIRLLLLAVLVLVPPMVWISVHAADELERGVAAEMDRKAATIGRDVADQVERALGYGIPLGRLVGVEDFLAPTLAANPELRYVAITDSVGKILFLAGTQAGSDLEPHYRTTDFDVYGVANSDQHRAVIESYVDLSTALDAKDKRVGIVHVGFSADGVHHRVEGIFTDVAVVIGVSLLLAAEILLFVVVVNVSGPLGRVRLILDRVRHSDFTHVASLGSRDEIGRFVRGVNAVLRSVDETCRRLIAYMDEVKTAHFDPVVALRVSEIEARVKFLYRFAPEGAPQVLHQRHAIDIRLPLFLFVCAEELSRPFLPLYVGSLPSPFPWLTAEMAMAIPIAVFMACVAFASPWAGAITGRLGSRRVFLFGLAPAVLGFVLSGLAQSVLDLTLWRAATGFGYAVVTMACQGYMSRAARDDSRAQGLGVFVGAVLAASVCGMGMGGVLVERVGFRDVFFVSAVLAMLSGVLVSRLSEPRDLSESRRPRFGDLAVVLRNWRFVALMLFAAIPAKLALTGVVYFLLPIYLWGLGYDFADIGRVLMLYGLVVVVLAPVVARLADRSGWGAGLIALGGLLGGTGLLIPALGGGLAPVILTVLCLGLAQGLSAAPQLAVIPDVCWIECRALGRTNVLAQVRLLERIGSVAGPLAAAILLPLFGATGAIVVLGGVVMATAIIFAILSFSYGAGPHIQSEDPS